MNIRILIPKESSLKKAIIAEKKLLSYSSKIEIA